jgi:hypothetical protein
MQDEQFVFSNNVKKLLSEESQLKNASKARAAIDRLLAREDQFKQICDKLEEYDYFKNPAKLAITLLNFAQNYEWSFQADPNYTRDIKRDIKGIKNNSKRILSTLKGRRIGPIRDIFDKFIIEAYAKNPELRGYSKSIDSLLLELLETLSIIDEKTVRYGEETTGIRKAKSLLKKINSKKSVQNLLAITIAIELFQITGKYLDPVNVLICESFLELPDVLVEKDISSLRESVGLKKSKLLPKTRTSI